MNAGQHQHPPAMAFAKAHMEDIREQQRQRAVLSPKKIVDDSPRRSFVDDLRSAGLPKIWVEDFDC